MSDIDTIDTRHTEWPVCPSCGHKHRDAREWRLTEEDDEAWECESCMAKFVVTLHVHRTFDTKAVPRV